MSLFKKKPVEQPPHQHCPKCGRVYDGEMITFLYPKDDKGNYGIKFLPNCACSNLEMNTW